MKRLFTLLLCALLLLGAVPAWAAAVSCAVLSDSYVRLRYRVIG